MTTKRFISVLALAAALVGQGMAVGALAASGKGFTLASSAARTSTTTHTAASISLGPTLQNPGVIQNSADMLTVQLNCTAASGTLDLTIEGSTDNSSWATLTGNSGWTQVTSTGNQIRYYTAPPRYVRAKATIGGGSPTFTYAVNAWALYNQ